MGWEWEPLNERRERKKEGRKERAARRAREAKNSRFSDIKNSDVKLAGGKEGGRKAEEVNSGVAAANQRFSLPL